MKKNLITINKFIKESLGEWKSIRSTHSLAFREVENTTSKIFIKELSLKNNYVVELLKNFDFSLDPSIAIEISWHAISDWEEEKEVDVEKAVLAFLPEELNSGILLRNKGYMESILSSSKYILDDKENLNLRTVYNSTITEEKISFLSKHVRSRYSVIRSNRDESVIQTSHTSEIRNISNLED